MFGEWFSYWVGDRFRVLVQVLAPKQVWILGLGRVWVPVPILLAELVAEVAQDHCRSRSTCLGISLMTYLLQWVGRCSHPALCGDPQRLSGMMNRLTAVASTPPIPGEHGWWGAWRTSRGLLQSTNTALRTGGVAAWTGAEGGSLASSLTLHCRICWISAAYCKSAL